MSEKLYYGAAYYPELWSEEILKQDIALMKEAGINVVRMGEFAWSVLEPNEGDFHVTAFANVVEKLYRHGISSILCTPTATPPIWISHGHEERMLVDSSGTRMVHGGRQQLCTNNEYFRNRAKIIIDKMAETYGAMPGVIAWQLDNEIKGNVAECFCENCNMLWHEWLNKKYGNIETLNQAWGTNIWSQRYQRFEQVPQPFPTPMGHNPSLCTDYKTFSHDKASEFLNEQADVIRKHSSLPITHNSSLNHFIDNEKTFENLDFVSFDHYSSSGEFHKFLSYIDAFKSLKNKKFWVMETAPSFSGSIYGYQPIHNDGYIQAEMSAAYALGAEGFCYWLWRRHRSGVEQPHGSVITSWGDKSVCFKNVAQAGKMREKLELAFANTVPVRADIACTYSDRARAFFMSEPLEATGFDYTNEMMNWNKMLLSTGLHHDIIFENQDFSGYKLLLTPFLPYLSKEYLERAKAFVNAGGIWIAGPLTSTRTEFQTVNTDHALGALEEFAEVHTRFHYPMTSSGTIGEAFGTQSKLSLWSSVFECLDDTTPQGIITSSGLPFITECKRGKGKVVLLGSMPEYSSGMLNRLILHYANQVIDMDARIITDASYGIIVVPRKGENIAQRVIINMDAVESEITLTTSGIDSFTGQTVKKGALRLAPYECRVIDFKP